MDKLKFAPKEYLIALSYLKTGFVSSYLPDNLTADTRITLMDRVTELEEQILLQIPTETELPRTRFPLVKLLKEDM